MGENEVKEKGGRCYRYLAVLRLLTCFERVFSLVLPMLVLARKERPCRFVRVIRQDGRGENRI